MPAFYFLFVCIAAVLTSAAVTFFTLRNWRRRGLLPVPPAPDHPAVEVQIARHLARVLPQIAERVVRAHQDKLARQAQKLPDSLDRLVR